MNKIIQMLSDGDGQVSTIRVGFFILLLGILIPKLVTFFKTGEPIVFSKEEEILLIGAFGAKAAQSSFENKTPDKPNTNVSGPNK